jgi:hydrogenase-4 membrane subunit HyfE
MDGAFAQLSMLGSSIVLIAGFLLLWRRGLSAHIDAFTLQSVALAAPTALVADFKGDLEL